MLGLGCAACQFAANAIVVPACVTVPEEIERSAQGRSYSPQDFGEFQDTCVMMKRYPSFTALLEDNGAQVFQAADGETAVRLARSEWPDLITLDLSMPVMDGGEAFELLRKDPELAQIRVCIITGQPELRRLIYDRAVPPPEGFLDKPIDDATLLLNVRKILEVG
jgi:CheY-like chemotaxis protein